MLYSNKKRLDPGINTELRILKMEDQRVLSITLLANLNKYAYTLEELTKIEKQISEDVLKLYTNDSIYSELAHNLNKALVYKSDIIKRETKSLKDVIQKNSSIVNVYNPLKPLIKHYFKSIDRNEHYAKKLPKVIDFLEGRKKIKGELTKRETEKLIRNKRKLENAQTDLKVVHESITAETNKVNLDRFTALNKVVKEFINTELSMTFLMTDKFGVLNNFETTLEAKEDDQFNEKYFLDIKKESKMQYSKSLVTNRDVNGEVSEIKPIKQNIQNNYYYLNRDDRGRPGNYKDPSDVIVGRESQYNGRGNDRDVDAIMNGGNMIDGDRRSVKDMNQGQGNNRALALMN